MSKWQEMTFGSFAQFNPKISLKKGEPYPFIPMENISPGQKFVKPGNTKIYSGGGAKFEEGDTLFARITPCLENGKIAQASSLNGKPGFGSTEFFIFRGKQNISDSDFVYYFSQTESFRENAIKSMVGASGRQRADATFVSGSIFTFPDLVTQQKIARILAAYDDLIENNLKRIKLLEEMAQITYEEWFVRLCFPGHESTPINPETSLPAGWKIKKLGEVTALIKRGISPQYVESGGLTVINQKCVRDHNVNLEVARQTSFSKKVPPEKMLKKYDVLINSTGTGTLGRVAQYFFNTSPATVDTHVTIVRASEGISSLYLGRFLERNEPYLERLGKGATNQKELSATDISNAVEIVVPDQDTQEQYHHYCECIFAEVTALNAQNILLREARDILLPRLMTGVIDVESYDPAQLLKEAA